MEMVFHIYAWVSKTAPMSEQELRFHLAASSGGSLNTKGDRWIVFLFGCDSLQRVRRDHYGVVTVCKCLLLPLSLLLPLLSLTHLFSIVYKLLFHFSIG